MRFAAKRLTRSDLTFFEYQFRRQNAGNQKSINLNRAVFIDLLFPDAARIAGGAPHQFPAPVEIFGPGMRAKPHVVTRKIIAAGGSQKNWRLNGEFVPDPDDDRTRYHNLSEGDVAVFGFEGGNVPTRIELLLLSHSEPADAPLLEEIGRILGSRSMAELSTGEITTLALSSATAHPIRELVEPERDDAVIEAALGSAAGIETLLRRPSTRRMSPESLAKARNTAEAIGRNGEVLVDGWLRQLVAEGKLRSMTWVSETNAVSPWDFEVIEASGEVVRIEVKSTTGPFERPFHLSQSEALTAGDTSSPRTDLYRIYGLSTDGANLRIARDVKSTCERLATAASALPRGFVPDSYTVQVDAIGNWGESQKIEFSEE